MCLFSFTQTHTHTHNTHTHTHSHSYKVQELGESTSVLKDIVSGKHAFSSIFAEAERPMVIMGMAALNSSVSDSVHSAVDEIVKKFPALRTSEWDGVNHLHTVTGR